MRFEWDSNKNRTNIKKHGIDFADVIEIFDHPMLTAIDNRMDYGETRWISVGLMMSITVVVVYVERHEDVIRLISARKANKYEEKNFKKALFGH